MSILRLNGSSGYTEITAPTSAGNNRLTLPTSNGSAGNILGTDGAGNLSWVNGGRMVQDTAKTASGTSINFTGLPSWVKRITVMFNGVSTNGTSVRMVQLGDSGGVETTGYDAYGLKVETSGGITPGGSVNGFIIRSNAGSQAMNGAMYINLLTGNTWVSTHSLNSGAATTSEAFMGSGSKTLSSTLDRIRITTVNGTDAFDAGLINILYEG